MLILVRMLLKGEFGGGALNSHGNYIVDHGKSWKNHGIVFLNFCGNPDMTKKMLSGPLLTEFSGSAHLMASQMSIIMTWSSMV